MPRAPNPSFEPTATGKPASAAQLKRWANTASPFRARSMGCSSAVQHQGVAHHVCHGPSVRWRPAHHRACAPGALQQVLRARPMARGQNRRAPAYALSLGVRQGCPSCGGPLTFGTPSTATAGCHTSRRASLPHRSVASSGRRLALWFSRPRTGRIRPAQPGAQAEPRKKRAAPLSFTLN